MCQDPLAKFRTLTTLERVLLVALVVGLFAANLWNLVVVVRKADDARRFPQASVVIESLERVPPLAISICYQLASPTALPASLSVDYYENITLFLEGGTVAPDLVWTGVTVPLSSLQLSSTACSEVVLPFELTPTGRQFMILSVVGGIEQSFFMLVRPANTPRLFNGYHSFQTSRSFEMGLVVAVVRSPERTIISYALEPVLTMMAQEPAHNQSQIFFAGFRVDFTSVSVSQQFIAFGWTDVLASLFAWGSLSATVFTLLFPVLPYAGRSRFFLCGAGPPDVVASAGAQNQRDAEL